MMRIILVQIVLISGIGAANAQSRDSTSAASAAFGGDAVNYYDGRGRLIGTTTKIAGTTYLVGADGEPIGTFETVGDRRIFKPRQP